MNRLLLLIEEINAGNISKDREQELLDLSISEVEP